MNQNRLLVYIASPYRLGIQAHNVHRQIQAAKEIMDLGHVPLVPLLNHFLDIQIPRDPEAWVDDDLVIVPKCDVLCRLDGESKGADREEKCAKENGIPVVYNVSGFIRWLRNGKTDHGRRCADVFSAGQPLSAKMKSAGLTENNTQVFP